MVAWLNKFFLPGVYGKGGPISPYLFSLCAEGFSALLNDAEMDGRIQGSRYVQELLAQLTFCLQMIRCFS